MTSRMEATKPFLVILFILLMLAQAAVLGQPAATDVPPLEAAPAYTMEQVNAALKEVVPLVEEVTGHKFTRVPPIKLITRQQLEDIINGGSDNTGHAGCSADIAAYAFGMYEPGERAIYMMPGNFRPRMNIAGVPAKYDQDILKMIVAHELGHAMQFQVVGFGRPRGRMSTSSSEAVRATVEGYGMFVMDQVAEKLGLSQAIKEFPKTISAGLAIDPEADCAKSPDIKRINESLRKEERSVYLDGEKFIRWHYIFEGNAAVFQILANPPRDWSVIMHPDRYSPAKQKEPAGTMSARLPVSMYTFQREGIAATSVN